MRQLQYEHINPSVLLNAVSDDVQAFLNLSLIFLDITPPMMARIRAAISIADSQLLAREAHALIGTTSLVGAAELTDILKQVEQWSWQAKMSEVVHVLPTLERLFASVEKEVAHTAKECESAAWRGVYCSRQGA